jgi:hypothetical protein
MPVYKLGGSPSLDEEDHLIPLELGAAPRNPKNLWPEPRGPAKEVGSAGDEAEAAGLQGRNEARRRACGDQIVQVHQRLAEHAHRAHRRVHIRCFLDDHPETGEGIDLERQHGEATRAGGEWTVGRQRQQSPNTCR